MRAARSRPCTSGATHHASGRSVAAKPVGRAARTAAVYGRRRFTYAELGVRVRRLATALRRAGLRDGDRVAFLAPNVPALLEAHFGVALAGGVLVAINTRLNADEIGYILDHSGARLLFADAELAPPLVSTRGARPALERIVTIADPEFAPGPGRALDGPEYEAFVDVEPDPSLAFRVADEDRAYSINYTSGTTGRPKGVIYTHRGAYLNALAEIIGQRLDAATIFLWTLPLFHCNGWCRSYSQGGGVRWFGSSVVAGQGGPPGGAAARRSQPAAPRPAVPGDRG